MPEVERCWNWNIVKSRHVVDNCVISRAMSGDPCQCSEWHPPQAWAWARSGQIEERMMLTRALTWVMWTSAADYTLQAVRLWTLQQRSVFVSVCDIFEILTQSWSFMLISSSSPSADLSQQISLGSLLSSFTSICQSLKYTSPTSNTFLSEIISSSFRSLFLHFWYFLSIILPSEHLLDISEEDALH